MIDLCNDRFITVGCWSPQSGKPEGACVIYVIARFCPSHGNGQAWACQPNLRLSRGKRIALQIAVLWNRMRAEGDARLHIDGLGLGEGACVWGLWGCLNISTRKSKSEILE